ncbi:anti-sigma factor [Sphingobium sp. MK2]|uniref:anti-sigma factor family protein n=1 Tax=Sphingobium sp. MK2 TaxID=3116540 RepID=UPI0032E3650F
MTDIDEAMLIAWVDGELDEVTRRRVERAVAEDPALAERLAIHHRLRHRLSGHYAPIEAEPVPPTMRVLLEQDEKVVPLMRPVVPRWRNWIIGGAMAASLILGLGISRLATGPGGPVAVKDGVIVAQGELSSALDTQLASAPERRVVRIGLSFQRKGGSWCRSFESAVVSGVACREGKRWQVQQLVPGAGERTDYRQASSNDARVIATIDALIEGSPADAAQEAAAKARGWQ